MTNQSAATTVVALCPVCGTSFEEADVIKTCPRCESPHHQDCWDYCGGCAIFACENKSWLSPKADRSSRQMQRLVENWLSSYHGEWSSLGVIAIGVVCFFFGLLIYLAVPLSVRGWANTGQFITILPSFFIMALGAIAYLLQGSRAYLASNDLDQALKLDLSTLSKAPNVALAREIKLKPFTNFVLTFTRCASYVFIFLNLTTMLLSLIGLTSKHSLKVCPVLLFLFLMTVVPIYFVVKNRTTELEIFASRLEATFAQLKNDPKKII